MDDARPALDVSRGTLERLEVLVDELLRWNTRINLIGRDTAGLVWSRHVEDSIQTFRCWSGQGSRWVDLGSGGGFPGLVVAALAAEEAPGLSVTLIEADARKAAFLAQAGRAMGVPVEVRAARVEAAAGAVGEVVSARALAPLPKLLALAFPHLTAGAQAIFPKGRTFRSEIEEARRTWAFACEAVPSRTDPEAAILSITALEPRA